METKPGAVVGGRYELIRELARGGMGSVWVAHHQQLDEQVAIKFMDGQLAALGDARARFEREAKAAAKLRSPHVVQILDYGVDDDTPYIVMELLEGEDLKRRLKSRGRLSLVEARDILIQACKALRLAADAGIVHRDLKPGNIFLARSGDDEIVKLLDFGVAKATKRTVGPNTTSGMILGSPHYMSPEQARAGASVDTRGDLWSMAVILFQMITGTKPFGGTELGDVIVRICTEPPPKVRSLVPELPEALDPFFERALAKDPNARFQSARSLASELAAIVDREAGLSVAPLSSSGRFSDPGASLGSGSFPQTTKALADPPSGSFPGGEPLHETGEVTHSPASRGTLAVATRSLRVEGGREGRRQLLVGAGAVAVVAAVGIFLALRVGGSKADSATAAASEAASPMPQASAGPSPAPDEEAVPAATVSATAEPEDSASSQPAASASAPKPAPKRPSRATRPAPKPSPKPASPQHPVLGF